MGRLLTLLRKKGADFSPLDLPGLALWLDASDASTITDAGAGAVEQWDDKSTNAYVFTQATSANRPRTGVVTVNALNALDFDGSDDSLNAAAATFGAPYTLFAVVSSDASSADYFWGRTSASPFHGGGLNSSNTPIIFGDGSSLSGTAVTVNTTAFLATYVFDATCSVSINGGTPNTGAVTLPTPTLTSIGVLSGTSNGWSGKIAEVIAYSRTLTAEEIAQVETFLADKWGVTL